QGQAPAALRDPITRQVRTRVAPDLFRVAPEEQLIQRPAELGDVCIFHGDDRSVAESTAGLRQHEFAYRARTGRRTDSGEDVGNAQRILNIFAVEVDPADSIDEHELVV